jgi:hypothetical protein
MQDRYCQLNEILLRRTAGPYIGVKSEGLAVSIVVCFVSETVGVALALAPVASCIQAFSPPHIGDYCCKLWLCDLDTAQPDIYKFARAARWCILS